MDAKNKKTDEDFNNLSKSFEEKLATELDARLAAKLNEFLEKARLS